MLLLLGLLSQPTYALTPEETNARLAALEARIAELEAEKAAREAEDAEERAERKQGEAEEAQARAEAEQEAAEARAEAEQEAAEARAEAEAEAAEEAVPPIPPIPPIPPTPPLPPISLQSGNPPVIGAVEVAADDTRPGLVALGGPVDVYGLIEGDAVSMGGPVRVHDGGRITGNAVSMGQNIEVASDGAIDGDAVTFGGVVTLADGGTIGGDKITVGNASAAAMGAMGPAVVEHSGFSLPDVFQRLFQRLSLTLAFAGAGVLTVGVWPRQVRRVAEAIPGNLLWYGLAGGILTAALTVASVLFAVTVIGAPVSLLIIALLGAAWVLGLVSLCHTLGERSRLTEGKGAWAAFLVGAALLGVIALVPYLGPVLVAVLGFPALGAALLTRFGTRESTA